MAVCAKCGSQAMDHMSGVSKTTGKPWQGWKCTQCKTMHGMNGIPWADKGSKPQTFQQTYQPEAQQSFKPPVNIVEKKLDVIISMLKTLQGDMGVEEVNKELQVESNESPF